MFELDAVHLVVYFQTLRLIIITTFPLSVLRNKHINTVHLVSSIYLLLMRLLHVSAPTCHHQGASLSTQVPKHIGAALVINILTKLSAQCWFFMHNPAMHGTNIKKNQNFNTITLYLPSSYHRSYTGFTIFILNNNYEVLGFHSTFNIMMNLCCVFTCLLMAMYFSLTTVDL
jgi:hypothetical protein